MKTIRLYLAVSAAKKQREFFFKGDRIAVNWGNKQDPGEWWLATIVKPSDPEHTSYVIKYDSGDTDTYDSGYMSGKDVMKVGHKAAKSKTVLTYGLVLATLEDHQLASLKQGSIDAVLNKAIKGIATKLKLPAGAGARISQGEYNWNKRGGYINDVNDKLFKNLEANGFKKASGKETGIPDGSYMGNASVYSDGNYELLYSSSFGPTKDYNSYSITLRAVKQKDAKPS